MDGPGLNCVGTRFRMPSAPLIVFLLATIYASCMFTLSREVVIPYVFGSESGLIPGDPEYYDNLAKLRVVAMRENGLAAFEYAPDGQGVVGIVSLVYFVVPYAYGLVVLNALLHGLASMTMFLLLRRWFSIKAAALGVLPVVAAPYMMSWFSGPNKDIFILAGVLLLVYGLTGLNSNNKRSIWRNAGIAILGAFIIGWVKPYINQILFPFVLVMFAGFVVAKVRYPNFRLKLHIALAGCAVLAAILLSSQGGRANDTIDHFMYNAQRVALSDHNAQRLALSDQCLSAVSDWQNTQWLPGALERRLKAIAGQRCLMFTLLGNQDHPATLASIIERDFMPRSGVEMVEYLPRAAIIGVLSPVPATWFQRPGGRLSTFYTVIPFEAALVYFGIVGFVVFVIRDRTYSITVPLALAVYAMTVYGMATPFIGALYRYRYPFWEILLCFGVAAIWSVMRNRTEAS